MTFGARLHPRAAHRAGVGDHHSREPIGTVEPTASRAFTRTVSDRTGFEVLLIVTLVMGLSCQISGFSSVSMLVPEALMAVATVALLYEAVRRISGPSAALLAGAALVLTPAAALMFRPPPARGCCTCSDRWSPSSSRRVGSSS